MNNQIHKTMVIRQIMIDPNWLFTWNILFQWWVCSARILILRIFVLFEVQFLRFFSLTISSIFYFSFRRNIEELL